MYNEEEKPNLREVLGRASGGRERGREGRKLSLKILKTSSV